MRVQSEKEVHNGGWLHPLNGDHAPVNLTPPKPEPPKINATFLMEQFAMDTPRDAIEDLASSLGVSIESLEAMTAAWAAPHHAWAFPMRDEWGNPCGIRLRADNGRKWAVTGSRQGIFLPHTQSNCTALVCEGPTDCAAALTLGFWAVGRPSCNCGENEIRLAFKRLHIQQAVIVADNDAPGLNGAEKISMRLGVPTVTYVPPAKDLRQFLQFGGTKALIESSIKSLVWSIPG